ncbi:type IV secretion system protein [Cetobacterium sp.]|uniref:type IV secretion system protein n=1 Tax=Cetobacterium sp. TaxID=2071632 RepID=UPI0025BAFEFD|nr:type IV secretion system protein [Cetobacterium sp.]
MDRYEQAKKEHFDMYMKQAKSIQSWKMAFMLSMMFNICALSVAGYLTTKSKLIPYVIEVDQTGNAKGINPAMQKNYVPQEAEKEYFLREFIKKARFISSDIDVINANFSNNRYFLTPIAQKKYLRMIETEDTNSLIQGDMTRTIQIQAFTKMAGTKNSYQARWNEVLFSKAGDELQQRNYTGIFTIEVEKPNSLQELENNPLGIKISDFSLSIEK